MSAELAVLQAIRLKGRGDAAAAAVCVGVDESTAAGILADLAERGLVKGGPAFRITPEGREHLTAALAAERAEVDLTALKAAYADFDQVNSELKAIVTAWQMRDPETPNDHTDAAYDATVIERLGGVDVAFTPVLEQVIAAAPRLHPYRLRFANALQRIHAADTAFVARPLIDSYHTVWFEFHEELIGLLGLSRADEAAAGRAL